MHEKCDLLAGAGYVAKIGIEARLRQHIGPGNDEILFRVGLAAGPFDFSAFMGGRNGNIETGVVWLHCPRRAEALFASVFFSRVLATKAVTIFVPWVLVLTASSTSAPGRPAQEERRPRVRKREKIRRMNGLPVMRTGS